MTYTPSAAGVAVPVTVTLTAHSLGFFDLQLTLTNNSGMTADQVRFPCPMVFDESQATGGFFPDKPGMLFSSEWFTTDLPAEGEHMMIHPPLMADLLGVQMGAGGFAQYAVWGPGPIRMTSLGFRHVEGTTGSLVHDYIVWRPDGYSWESPPVRFRITGDFFESIRAYREDNGIDQFESVSQKLGALYDTVITSPMFAWDGDWFGEYSGWGDFFDRLPKPSVLFMGNYWPGGFHGHHPDLLPPNSVHGTEQELLDALSYARQTGHILASMILPSWWHEESPTIQNLSSTGYTLEDIAEIDAEGRVDYGCWELGGVRDCGYSVSPRAPYVVTRIDRMMNELRDAGFDLLYEDVIGACGFGPDYNASAPDTIDSEKWIDHTRTYQSYGLLTETGYDYLAETQVGFLGGGAGPSWAGAPGGSVRLFPFTGLLLRDKVLQYHY
jgi:hypothetical protein